MAKFALVLFLLATVGAVAQHEPIPFSQLDVPPLFKGCIPEPPEAAIECTNKTLEAFVKGKFNTGLFKNLNLNEKRVRVYAQFTITTQGTITDILVRTAHPQLKKETIRVLGLVPHFTPARHNGKMERTKYVLPLVFTLG